MSKELEVAIVNLFSSKTNDRNTIDTLYSVADNKVKVIFKDNAVYLYELRADIDLVLVYHLTISKLVYNSRVYEVERIGELANYLHVKHTYNNGMELEPLNHAPVHSFI
mgnify:CR=1 FL=1